MLLQILNNLDRNPNILPQPPILHSGDTARLIKNYRAEAKYYPSHKLQTLNATLTLNPNAQALAKLVTDEHRAEGAIFPPISDLRNISAHVAKAVAQKAYDAGVATQLPKPPDLLQTAFKFMYRSSYRNYR